MPKKTNPKPKKKPAKRKPHEDVNQTAYRVVREIIKKSEGG
jgi:hypothetical protein